MATYVYEVPLGKLEQAMRKHGAEVEKALMKGLRSGAARAQADLKANKDPWDRGMYAGAWTLTDPSSRQIILSNSTPYAGIIERGARPHKIGKAGRAAIREWVIRKGILQAETKRGRMVRVTSRNKDRFESLIDGVVWAICKKIEKEGRKPMWVVRSRLPKFRKYAVEETERTIAEAFGIKPI